MNNNEQVAPGNPNSTLPRETPASIYLRRSAERIRSAPPLHADEAPFRVMLMNLLRDLRRAGGRWQVQALAAELFSVLASNALRDQGIGGHSRKHLRAALLKDAPDFCGRLGRAFQSTVSAGDALPMIEFGAEQLDRCGGPMVSEFVIPLPHVERLPLRLGDGDARSASELDCNG